MKYSTVGTIVNTHGLKGEVKVKIQTHFIEERFAKNALLYVETDGNYLPVEVKHSRMHKGMMLLTFVGYENINDVEGWKGCRLYVANEQRQDLEEDEIYYSDLIGLQVQTTNGEILGNVSEILETGAHAVIRVQGEKELLIPYVKTFIKEVDLPNGSLTVELLEGML